MNDAVSEVKKRIDIVDLIGSFIELKQSGRNFKAVCPFHQEKTPSFFVSPAKGIYKDFSSGKGGDAINFIMEYDGLSYIEAIKYLGKKYGNQRIALYISVQKSGSQPTIRLPMMTGGRVLYLPVIRLWVHFNIL